MNKFDETLAKFIKTAVENKADNVELITTLKEIALERWNIGSLSDSEHCDIEAWLDHQLFLRESL